MNSESEDIKIATAKNKWESPQLKVLNLEDDTKGGVANDNEDNSGWIGDS